jgi:hypothetical protein
MPEMPYLWMETWEKSTNNDVVLVFERNTGGIRIQEQASNAMNATAFSNVHKFDTYELALDWLKQNEFSLKGVRAVFGAPSTPNTPPTIQK